MRRLQVYPFRIITRFLYLGQRGHICLWKTLGGYGRHIEAQGEHYVFQAGNHLMAYAAALIFCRKDEGKKEEHLLELISMPRVARLLKSYSQEELNVTPETLLGICFFAPPDQMFYGICSHLRNTTIAVSY